MNSSPDSSTNWLCDLVKIILLFCASGFSYVKWESRKKKRAATQWAVFMKSSILIHTMPLEQRLVQNGSLTHAGWHDPLGWVKQAHFLLPHAHLASVCVHRLYYDSASSMTPFKERRQGVGNGSGWGAQGLGVGFQNNVTCQHQSCPLHRGWKREGQVMSVGKRAG